MRLFSMMILPMVFATGCATVPKDAPNEFHNAETSINEMNDRDVEEYMPKSAEMANNKFDNALDLLDQSKEDQPKVTQSTAVAKAKEAQKMADELNSLDARINSWDSDNQGFGAALAALDGDYDTEEVAVIEPATPFAKLRDMEIISTVAFFDTNVADKAILNEKELTSLTNILKKDENFQVVLTGFADPRGAKEYNQKLSMQRAQTIAAKLTNQGILDSQIIIESFGEMNGDKTKNSAAKLQLDRKVSAKLILR